MWNHITLQPGDTGLTVKKLQAALGVAEDGVFGPDTTHALMAFQEEQGIDVDGIVGPVTLYHLNLFT
jgi:peptidoglycan hydrolase-like protein with peptidoglycan-binding domain